MCPPAASHENVSLTAELDRWQAAGRQADVWLRDDDACRPSPALDTLIAKLSAHRAPCLLAVIPMLAGSELAERLRAEPLIHPAVHGARHVNHAPPGAKKAETPMARGMETIVQELDEARRRLIGLLGERAGDWYVPPWNRIDPAVAGELAGLGFRAVSTFAEDALNAAPPLVQRNTHVDIIDWKAGRIGRPAAEVLDDLAAALGQARATGWHPVGVLLHHLVHDAAAWAALDAVLESISTHPAARWRRPDDILGLC